MKIFSKDWIAERIRVYCFGHLLNCGCLVLVALAVGVFLGWDNVRLDIESIVRSWFHLEILLDPEDSITDEYGRTTWVVTPDPCPSAPRPHLNAGDRAIQMQPGGINLRREPNVADRSNKIRTLEKCELVSILEGPTCVSGYNLFLVNPDGSQEGWAAESDKERQKYWLVPLLDEKKCTLPPVFVEGETATSDHLAPGIVRERPNLSSNRLPWMIFKGDSVTIIDGPICNETYIWYKIHGDKHPDPGWTELGRGNDYFFEIPVRFAATNDESADASCIPSP